MTTPAYVEGAIQKCYKLESLLRILSLAVDGEQIAGTSMSVNGGGSVIDLAASIAGEITNALEIGEMTDESSK